MQRTNGKLISVAEYARLRGLNRSTINRQVAEGKIPTTGGKIDPVAADCARERNLNPVRREQAARRKEAAKQPLRATPAPVRLAPAGTLDSDAEHLLIVAVIEQIRAPEAQLRFARACKSVGCSPEQSAALGMWFSCAVDLLGLLTVEDVLSFQDPDDADWVKALGELDLERAYELYEHADDELRPDSEG